MPPCPDAPRGDTARARVVLLTGPSGSGKSRIALHSGLPVLSLDDFYKDRGDPTVPFADGLAGGMIDWDDPASWNARAAVDAIRTLCLRGAADVPVYDIAHDHATGSQHLDLGGARAFVAEGVFAAEITAACAAEDLLAAAVVLRRNRAANAVRRLTRDLAERRKPPLTLVRRGWALYREEADIVASQVSHGARACSRSQTERLIRSAAVPAAQPGSATRLRATRNPV